MKAVSPPPGGQRESGIHTLGLLCGAFAAASAAGVFLLDLRGALLAAALMLLALPAGLLLRGNRRRVLVLILLGAALGLGRYAWQCFTVLAPAQALSGSTRTVTARVTDYPVLYDHAASLRVRLTGGDTPHGFCQLTVYDELPPLEPGDEIRAEVRFTSAFYRYGEETDLYSASGIFLRGVCDAPPAVVGHDGASLLYAPRRLYRLILNRVQALFPADVAAFHAALLTGSKSELYQDVSLYYALAHAGLMHVTAVSGMHVAFLVGFLLLLCRNRRTAALLGCPLLLLFAALAGFTPSICRAVFMQIYLLSAPLLRREGDAPTSLALILAILLFLNPCAAASVSLQLSFAATAGILLFASRLQAAIPAAENAAAPRGPRSVLSALARSFAASAAASCSALVFTMPLMVIHFGVVSVAAPVVNALCLGLISLLFVLGYVSLALGAVLPTAGRLLAAALAWGDRLIFTICRLAVSLPCAVVYTTHPVWRLWLVFVGCLLLAALAARRRGGAVRPLLPVLLALLTLFSTALFQQLYRPAGMRVTALDVGQGSCTVMESAGNTVMVDCGGGGKATNAGETAAYYLLGRGVDHLDALILTHLHTDHANGVERLLALLKVDAVYLPAEDTEPGGMREAVLAACEKYAVPVVPVTEELRLQGERAVWELSAPMGREEAEGGLFVHGAQGEFDVLITGDAAASRERRYLEQAGALDVEVLVVGHHGSDTSTDRYFIRSIRPEIALISVGYNFYGHPRQATLDTLLACGAEIHRTDQEGHLVVVGGE